MLESSKSIALAAVWARKDFTMAEFLLRIPNELFGIKEVLKALTTLDAARNKRALEKLLKRFEAQGCKKKQKMDSLKSLIGSLEAEILPVICFLFYYYIWKLMCSTIVVIYTFVFDWFFCSKTLPAY